MSEYRVFGVQVIFVFFVSERRLFGVQFPILQREWQGVYVGLVKRVARSLFAKRVGFAWHKAYRDII